MKTKRITIVMPIEMLSEIDNACSGFQSTNSTSRYTISDFIRAACQNDLDRRLEGELSVSERKRILSKGVRTDLTASKKTFQEQLDEIKESLDDIRKKIGS